MIDAGELDQLLRASGVPISGCAIGDPNNKATWRVDFDPSATQDHRNQAEAVIAAYVEPTAAAKQDKLDDQRVNDKPLIAVSMALWECIPAPTMTKAQLRVRIKAIFKTL